MVHFDRQEQIDTSGDSPVGDSVERYDITAERFERLFVRPWKEIIREAMGKMDLSVADIDLESAEVIDEVGAVHPDQISAAFTNRANWIPPPTQMDILNKVPNVVFGVRLSTGESVRVALTGMNGSDKPDSYGFVVLKKAA